MFGNIDMRVCDKHRTLALEMLLDRLPRCWCTSINQQDARAEYWCIMYIMYYLYTIVLQASKVYSRTESLFCQKEGFLKFHILNGVSPVWLHQLDEL